MTRNAPIRFARSDEPLVCGLCYRKLDADENAYCRETEACTSRQIAVQRSWRALRNRAGSVSRGAIVAK